MFLLILTPNFVIFISTHVTLQATVQMARVGCCGRFLGTPTDLVRALYGPLQALDGIG